MSWAGWVPQIDGTWVLLDDDGNLVERSEGLPPAEELDPADRAEFYPEYSDG